MSDLESRLERSRDAGIVLGIVNDGLCGEEQRQAVRKLIAKSIARENQIPDSCFEDKKAELQYRAELYRYEENLIRQASTEESAVKIRVEMAKLKSRQQLDVIFNLINPFPLAEACLEVIPADQRIALFRGRYCRHCGEVDHHGTCTCMRDE
jgi:hypothetical protein